MIGRANVVAKNEQLTEKTLLKEIFGVQQNTFKLRKKKKDVLKQLKYLERYTEKNSALIAGQQFIVYSLIRLWHEGLVTDYNFISAWRKNMARIIILYRSWYDDKNIEELQRALVVV